MIVAEKWRPVDEQPRDEDELRSFVAEKLGDLQGQFSKLIATLNLLTPGLDQSARTRRLLHILIVLVLLLYVLLGLHVAWTAGWLGS